MELRDLPPRQDPKGGSPKTPPGGISVRQFHKIMSDMTKGEVAAISLKEHFDAIRIEQDRRIEQAMKASRDAVDKAEKAQERRLDLLNEFRAQAADEAKRYATRETVDGFEKIVDGLSNQISRLYGGVIVVGIIGIANLVKLFFGH